ncbi:MAG: hypothetical protein AAGC95_12140 [Pseudomonadota bacterium]
MRVRTFIAPSFAEAKDRVFRELGEDAVIISTNETPGGGVEIRAAVDRGRRPHPAAGPETDKNRLDVEKEKRVASEVLTSLRADLTTGKTAPPTLSAAPISRTAAQSRAGAEGGGFFANNLQYVLAKCGFTDKTTAALSSAALRVESGDEVEALSGAFEIAFQFAPLPAAPRQPVMLVGPTGAGKTSTAAKLAARAAMEGAPVSIFAADTARAGAVEQIQTYADALQIPLWTTETPDDAAGAIASGAGKGVVIIDTPGINPYDPDEVALLRGFQDITGAEPILVLPASGDAGEYADIAEVFAGLGVERLVLTKLDSARRIGAGLSAAFGMKLALCQFGISPYIADGLETAAPYAIAARLLRGEAPIPPQNEATP